MTRKFSSISVQTTLSVGVSNTALVMAVPVGTGSTLMGGVSLAAANVDQYALNIDPNTASAEVVYVTGVSGDNLTVLRGQDGTSAIAHNAGAVIQHTLTGGDLAYFTTAATPTANLTVGLPFPGSTSGTNTLKAPAIAGTVVTTLPGATDTLVGKATTDVLTNKDLTSVTNTFPTSVATLTGIQTLTNKTLTAPIIDNPALGFATTVTAAGTTTLTVASAHRQEFTGTTTQILVLPVAATMTALGQGYKVPNNSTGTVTVNSSGANLVYAIPANTEVTFTVKLLSGTTAASWDYKITGQSIVGGLTLIQSQVVSGSPAAIMTFNTGLAGYKDLFLSWEARTNTAAINDTVGLRINGDAAGNYDFEDVTANASASVTQEVFAAISAYIGQCTGANAGANLSGAGEITFYNYAASVFNKRIRGTSGYKTGTASGNLTKYEAEAFWRNSAAITSFTLQTVSGGSFIIGSTFNLWGRV